MKKYEQEVFEEFAKPENVKEPWNVYDSIVICQQLLGSESTIPGWFTTFAAFGQRETHSLYKNRTDTTAGEMYNNQKNSDTMDFAFKAHSFGLEIAAPSAIECQSTSVDGADVDPTTVDPVLPHWFAADLPRHMAIDFRVQQDTRIELPSMAAPAGVGAVGGGTSLGWTNAIAPAFGEQPFMTGSVAQSVPLLSNRYPLPEPIGIPRTATIEAVLHLSQLARHILTNITGPHLFMTNSNDGAPSLNFAYTRYVIRVSLIGERLVQQRAQYHR